MEMSDKKTIHAQIQKLTRDELLALFEERGLLFIIKPIDILMAKSNVLVERADAVFGAWKDFELPDYGDTDDATIAYYQAKKEKEKLFKKWERMRDKIDKLSHQIIDMEY